MGDRKNDLIGCLAMAIIILFANHPPAPMSTTMLTSWIPDVGVVTWPFYVSKETPKEFGDF